jgi:hypothetical protein
MNRKLRRDLITALLILVGVAAVMIVIGLLS